MNYELKHKGFSLTEVLMAVGIFSVAMIFIAGVFPVAIHFTTIASEQTIAAVVADEAFAKIRLYDVNFISPYWFANPSVDFNDVSNLPLPYPGEYAYPSDSAVKLEQKQYFWSAVCRLVGGRDVQVTVFVSRKIGTGTTYRNPLDPFNVNAAIYYPKPVPVNVRAPAGGRHDELEIIDTSNPTDARPMINDGYTIVDNRTGRIYRVLERYKSSNDNIILLDKDCWDSTTPAPDYVWVIPPPVNGGRYPCVGVFQKVIRF